MIEVYIMHTSETIYICAAQLQRFLDSSKTTNGRTTALSETRQPVTRRTLRFVVFASVSMLLSCLNTSAFGCSCPTEQPPCVAYQKAEAIFIGVVTDITNAPVDQVDNAKEFLIHFSVDHSFKGEQGTRLEVATTTGTDCDFEFKLGEKYLVYGYRDSRRHRLFTGLCARTRLFAYAEDDLAYFRELPSSTARRSLMAVDGRSGRSLLKGADVIVEGLGSKYETAADSRGAFKIELALPGRYKVTVIGRSGLEFVNHLTSWRVFSVNRRPALEFEVNVVDGSCELIDFGLFVTVRESKHK